jgi:hypothetical protein
VAQVKIYKKAVIKSTDFVMKSLTITEAKDAPDLIPQDLIESWTAAAEAATVDEKEKTDFNSEVSASFPDHNESHVLIISRSKGQRSRLRKLHARTRLSANSGSRYELCEGDGSCCELLVCVLGRDGECLVELC